MYRERERENWTQTIRRLNLEKTIAIIKQNGGYSTILNNMRDFERYLALTLGCSIKTAKEYIDTVRGASIFIGKNLESGKQEE